jgi:RES domain-containing protein
MSRVFPGSRVATNIHAYRILKRNCVDAAFSGEGARLYGGRWNSPGVAVVYTSSVISLAILEWRCHLTQRPAPASVLIEIGFDASLVWSPSRLPANWWLYPFPIANAAFGDHWVRSGRSAVLKLPSATVPRDHEEYNYLLNPPIRTLVRSGWAGRAHSGWIRVWARCQRRRHKVHRAKLLQ